MIHWRIRRIIGAPPIRPQESYSSISISGIVSLRLRLRMLSTSGSLAIGAPTSSTRGALRCGILSLTVRGRSAVRLADGRAFVERLIFLMISLLSLTGSLSPVFDGEGLADGLFFRARPIDSPAGCDLAGSLPLMDELADLISIWGYARFSACHALWPEETATATDGFH